MSDDSIVLCVYFIVLGVVVIVGMGGISCVSTEEKADDAVAKISEAIEKLESKLRAQDLEIERLKKARRGRE